MKTEKIIWGLIFIFIGGVFLLENFDIIDFYWGAIWRFWPIIFILIGANMLFNRFEDKRVGPLLAGGVTILVLAFIGYQGTRPHTGKGWVTFNYEHDDDGKANWSDATSFMEPMTSAKNVKLKVQGGATSYFLKDSSESLFQADVKESHGGYSLHKTTLDSVDVLVFKKRDNGGRKVKMKDVKGNDTRMRINKIPVWDIEVEMGAGTTKFDLEKFKVRSLSFEGGAASFYARLGSEYPQTDVSVETGVASVEIEVPASSGTRITVDSGLSSKDFQGFIKQSDGSYKSSNYETATNKINIRLEGGLSSFEVKKY